MNVEITTISLDLQARAEFDSTVIIDEIKSRNTKSHI